MTWRALLLAATAAAACTDPAVTVELVFPPAPDPARPDVSLEQAVVELRLIVYELASKTCDDVALGRVSDREKDVALRTSITFTRTAGSVGLSGIPRTGAKQFVVEGFDGGGELIAGGCAEVGDIEDDRPVTIEVEPALRLRLVPLPSPTLELPACAPLSVVQTERWSSSPKIDGTGLVVFARSPAAEHVYLGSSTAPDPALPVVRVSLPDQLPVDDAGLNLIGSTEVVIRAPWADQAVRIPAYVKPRVADTVDLDDAHGWTFTVSPAAGQVAPWFRAAVVDGPDRLVVIERVGASLVRRAFFAPGIRAATMIDTGRPTQMQMRSPQAHLVTRLSDGWHQVDWSQHPPILAPLGAALATTAADKLIAMPRCGDQAPSIGLLSRSGAGPYAAEPNVFDGVPPAELDGIATQLGQLAATFGAVTVANAVCITDVVATNAATRSAAVAVVDDGTRARVVLVLAGAVLETPFEGAVTSRRQTATNLWTVIGAEPDRSGHVLRSYRLAGTVLIPDTVVDQPIAAPPRSLRVFDANLDQRPDALATLTYGGQTAIQFNFGVDEGEPSLSTVRTSPDADPDIVMFGADLGADGRKELVVAGRSGLRAFDLTTTETPAACPPLGQLRSSVSSPR